MQDASAASLWPLVKKIVLSGPWEVLGCGRGVVLVDAPGIGDDNSARDARVQYDLEQADAVWLCSNINRAVNDAEIKVRFTPACVLVWKLVVVWVWVVAVGCCSAASGAQRGSRTAEPEAGGVWEVSVMQSSQQRAWC